MFLIKEKFNFRTSGTLIALNASREYKCQRIKPQNKYQLPDRRDHIKPIDEFFFFFRLNSPLCCHVKG